MESWAEISLTSGKNYIWSAICTCYLTMITSHQLISTSEEIAHLDNTHNCCYPKIWMQIFQFMMKNMQADGQIQLWGSKEMSCILKHSPHGLTCSQDRNKMNYLWTLILMQWEKKKSLDKSLVFVQFLLLIFVFGIKFIQPLSSFFCI